MLYSMPSKCENDVNTCAGTGVVFCFGICFGFFHLDKGDKVSTFIHAYPHKPLRKNKLAICNHQVDSLFNLWPGVC